MENGLSKKGDSELSKFMEWKLREGNPLYRVGSRNLSNRDLLAHLLQDVESAEKLLDTYQTLEEIGKRSVNELKTYGLSQSNAERLHSAFELSRRYGQSFSERVTIGNPADVARVMIPIVRGSEKECLYILILDTKMGVKKVECVTTGILNASLIHPREIFKIAIAESASSIIISHNHPSGNCDPSGEDIKITKVLVQSGELLQIPVNDHVIIGDGTYYSLKENGLL